MPHLITTSFLRVFLFATVACPLFASAQAPATRPVATIAETPLYKIPAGTKVTDTLVSPDNLYVGVLESKDRQFHLVINGVRSPAMEWVVRGSLLFSAEGGRFSVQTQVGDVMHLVVGQAGPKWESTTHPGYYLVGRAVFSTDGKRLAYLAQKAKDGKMFVVLDGKEQPGYDEVYAADMQFSPDGKHFAYRARQLDPAAVVDPAKPKAGGKQLYVLDGVPQPGFDLVGRLVFAAEGDRWGYIARNDKLSAMVIDGKPLSKFAVVAGLAFSADGKRYAYAIEPAAADGKPSGKQSLIYNAGDGEKQFQPFDGIGAIVFSPDGRRVAVTTLADKKWSVFLDGKSTGSYDGTGGLLFSPDSKRLAAVAGRDRRQFVVIDGKESASVDVVATASFSPDSTKLVSVAINGAQRLLFVDDKQVGPATFFAFSPDSAHMGHALPAGDNKWSLGLDGQAVGPVYDAAPPGARLIWESPTVARIIAGRGTEMFSVKMTVDK